MKTKKVTVIGGGTGTFTVLSGLKDYPVDVGVIVAMTDSGGSTGKLRDQYGVLPPGDLRQCLVALSESDDIWRQLFLYRFSKGDFTGHNFGNILLAVLEQISPSYKDVVKLAGQILNIKGEVIPVTLNKTNLKAVYESGRVALSEAIIDENNRSEKIISLTLNPDSKANLLAIKRLKESDVVVLGPGDLFTSLIPCLLPLGIIRALSDTKIIYVVNLMNKAGQTDKMKASGHVEEIEKYLKRKVDKILINSSPLPKLAVTYYEKYNEDPVEDDFKQDRRVIRADLLSFTKYRNKAGDVLKRSLLRHDSDKLANVIYKTAKLLKSKYD